MILLLLLLSVLSSCSSVRYIPPKEIPVVSTTEKIVTLHTVDTLYIKDSINTVYKDSIITKYKERIMYKYKYIHDTCLVHDTIQIPIKVPVEVYIEKEPSILVRIFRILLVIFGAIIFIITMMELSKKYITNKLLKR